MSCLLALLALVLPGNHPVREADGLIRDDFANGLQRWEVLDADTWRAAEASGRHTVEITQRKSGYRPPHRSPFHVALAREVHAGDLEMVVRVRSPEDTGPHRDCCLFFGWQDAAHFYYVHVGAEPDANSGQVHLVNGADRRPLTKNKNRIPWTDGWHTVRLTRCVITGEIALYFDDAERPVMKVVDRTLGSGRIGIGSFDDRCVFDEVVARCPASNEGGPASGSVGE